MAESADFGTVIPSGECALISSGGMKGLELFVPGEGHLNGSALVPEVMLYITACMIRGHDAEFFSEMVDWLKSQKHS